MHKTFVNLLACFIYDKKKRDKFRNAHRKCYKVISDGSNIITSPKAKSIDIYVKGNGNVIDIDNGIDSRTLIHIRVVGDNNNIKIKKCNAIINLSMGSDDGRSIHNSSFEFGESYSGSVSYVMMEDNTHIKIGDRCMFSNGIMFRCTDDHAIISLDNGEVINRARSIEIGDHVWIGMNVSILKNSKIADGCIVGMNSVVAGKFNQKNCVICGNSARVVRENVKWDGARPDLYHKPA